MYVYACVYIYMYKGLNIRGWTYLRGCVECMYVRMYFVSEPPIRFSQSKLVATHCELLPNAICYLHWCAPNGGY